MSVSHSFSHIIECQGDVPADVTFIQLAQLVYDGLGKKISSKISREELVTWAMSALFEKGVVRIDSIFELLVGISESVKSLEP
jgi:hypothetical protein